MCLQQAPSYVHWCHKTSRSLVSDSGALLHYGKAQWNQFITHLRLLAHLLLVFFRPFYTPPSPLSAFTLQAFPSAGKPICILLGSIHVI